ncbi:MAG: beta-L-arabinofuranosidase domain-containing protein [Mangrovibacterium sp.]
MVRKIKIVLIIICIYGDLFAQKIVNDRLFAEKAIPIENISDLGGFFGDRVNKNRNVYLKNFPVETYLEWIKKQEYTDWAWTPEQLGKWIESSIYATAQSGDKELKNKIEGICSQLFDCQEPEGYLGPTPKSFRTPEKPLRGMEPYELYYLLHALISLSEQLNDSRGLESAKRLGDYFVRYIGPGKAEFWPSPIYHYPENVGRELSGQSNIAGHSVHYGWEGTLLIDPMSRLYMMTGDKKYLDWCLWVVQNIDKWSGFASYSKLDAVVNGKITVDELQPYVHSHTFQMNFLGFLNLYQITGDESYLRKVKAAWDDIARRQMYITGGVSVAEHYEKGDIKPLTGNVIETCASMTWMLLTQYLLELTGDVKYADAMEKLIWNHVFAAQSADGVSCKYHTAPNGFKPSGYFRGPDCCTASGGRILSMLPSFIYASKGHEIFINQFVESTAKFTFSSDEKVVIRQKTSYPETDKIKISVEGAKESSFKMHIRIPSWCKEPAIKLNGKVLTDVVSGQYTVIEREWKKGDGLEIVLPMELKWVEHDNYLKLTTKILAGGETMYEGTPDQKNAPYALMRGPLVYMADNIWLNNAMANYPREVDKDVKVFPEKNPGYEVVKLKSDNVLLGPVYKVPVRINDITSDVIMLPFANAGNWYRDAKGKGDRNASSYSYAIWLNKFDGK